MESSAHSASSLSWLAFVTASFGLNEEGFCSCFHTRVADNKIGRVANQRVGSHVGLHVASMVLRRKNFLMIPFLSASLKPRFMDAEKMKDKSGYMNW
ncbi:hypothetical protein TNCV_2745161 [Trichonephila clavipes]|nr:hypothetical protein TNCV_2745161 [Trichonephila clavipes]